MRATEVEAWAYSVIERVEKSEAVEDSRVEIKADWIEAKKASRRIAGHANAAGGEPILWLFGLDEKKGVVGVKSEELRDWHAQFTSCFDDYAPELLHDLRIPAKGTSIAALLFATDRPPYVVKNAQGGEVQREVPWRTATGVVSARRRDLLRLLVPVQRIPDVDVCDAELYVPDKMLERAPEPERIRLRAHAYLVPRGEDALVIPFHKCTGFLTDESSGDRFDLHDICLSCASRVARGTSGPRSVCPAHLQVSDHDVCLSGPAMLAIYAAPEVRIRGIADNTRICVHLRLGAVDLGTPIYVDVDLNPAPETNKGNISRTWVFRA